MCFTKTDVITGTSLHKLVVSCFLCFHFKKKKTTFFLLFDYQTRQCEYVFSMHEFFGVQILNLAESHENSISHEAPAEA